MNKLLIIAASAILLAGCKHPTTVTVLNQSPATLTNVVASGSRFSAAFGPLAPGAQETVILTGQPNDGSEVKLEFDANGKHFSNLSPKIQWREFKGVSLAVAPNFSIGYEYITTF